MACRNKRKDNFLRKLGTVLIALGAVSVILLLCIDLFIRPTLMTMLDYKCRTVAERIISDAVFGQLSGEGDLGNVMTFTFGNDGSIAAVSADQAKINGYKALINEAVNDGIDSIRNETVGISVGTLTGLAFLYGMGSQLVFNIEPQGKAETKLVSSFKHSGINQTIHSIILEVDAEMSPMMPGFSQTVEVSYDILLSQTVIVGNVPEQYSYIVLDEENMTELADIDI